VVQQGGTGFPAILAVFTGRLPCQAASMNADRKEASITGQEMLHFVTHHSQVAGPVISAGLSCFTIA
jgi:hypothetical protein